MTLYFPLVIMLMLVIEKYDFLDQNFIIFLPKFIALLVSNNCECCIFLATQKKERDIFHEWLMK